MTTVAALVVGYHSSHEIEPMAQSLRESIQGSVIEVDIHVIDNSGSSDEAAALRTIVGVDRVVASETNLGYGGGMNALAQTLTSQVDWLLVCNPDIRFSPGSVEALIDAAERHADAAIVGPLITDEAGNVYPSARTFPSIRTGVGHAIFARAWPSNPWTAKYHRVREAGRSVEQSVDWLSGACLLIRPDDFASVGGFDEGYFMYFEDVDLAWRFAKRGRRSIYAPSAVIVHSGAHSTSTRAKAMRDAHHRSASRFMGKKYAAWWRSPLRWTVQFGLYVRRVLGRR